MDLETFIGVLEEFSDFKKVSTVQEILKENVENEEICNSSDPIWKPQAQIPFGALSELTENLFLCSASMVNPSLLENLNVSCVINVAPELPDPPLHSDHVIYHKIPVLDSGNCRISAYFDETADMIQEVANAGGRTLVYCVAGVSRSASICLSYLMKHQRLTLLEAYKYVKARRPRIRPNCGFFKQLIDYEKELFANTTVRMVFNESVQMEIPDVYDSEYQFVGNFAKKRKNHNGRH